MASQGGMHNLTTLIKRLEAATSRLEDIASSSQSLEGEKPAHGTSAAAVSRAASTNGEVVPSPTSTTTAAPAPAEDLPRAIEDFDQLIRDDAGPFQNASAKLGGLTADSAASFLDAFKAQRTVLFVAAKAKKPSETAPVFMDILQELQRGIVEVNNLRDKNRKSPQENHLATLVEGSGAFNWLLQPGKPDDYIGEVLGGARMYGNRILTQYKDKDKVQVEWVNAFANLLNALKAYTKQHFARGLTWNANGIPPEEALKQVQSIQPSIDGATSVPPAPPPPPPAGGAPPPPPPPMPPAFDITPSAPQQPSNDMGAVFAELNRGEAVTSGLKKVDKSQMTHKNPSLKAQPPIEPSRSDSNSSRGKSPTPSRKPESLRAKKPSRKDLEGNKWTIENFESESTPITIQAEKQQSILVSRCKSVDILVNGKANGIIVDGCQRVNLVVETLVSAIEVVNCSRFNAQVTGTLPSIQLDKVDQCSVYLSEESLRQTEVYTSKCSSVNVVVPPRNEEADSVECPVPEQFKSYINERGELVTEVVKQEG